MSAFNNYTAAARLHGLLSVIALFCAVQQATAAVTTVGVVTPVPPVAGGTFTTQLVVGAGTVETSNNIWGWVSVDNGTLLQYGSLIAGDNEGFFGEMNVTGNFLNGVNTQLNFSAQGSSSQPTVQIGNEGTGYLNVNGGAKMTLTSQSADMAIGLTSTGVGYATVSDQFTILTVPETIVVGQSGVGYLNISDKAFVRTTASNRVNYISIGRNASGVGDVVVDGQGTLLQSGSSLRVGESGQGSLEITHGGFVQVTNGSNPLTGTEPFVSIGTNATGIGSVTVDGTGSRLQTMRDLVVGGFGSGTLAIRNGGLVQIVDKLVASATVGALGRVELSGGTFDGSTPVVGFGTTVNGYMGGAGLVRGSVQFGEDSFLEANPGDFLRFNGNVSNQGSVTVNAGDVQFQAGFTNNAFGIFAAPGRISLENGGTVRFNQLLVNNGVISAAHGTPNIHGAINNVGDIVVARDTVATFYDTVNNTGTITVKPGGNALFLADLTFIGLSTLQLGLGTNESTDGSAQINSSGAVSLGGTLEVTFDGSFTPTAGQSFELISAGGGISGAFDSVLLPLLPQDLELGLQYSASGVMMEIKLAGTSTGGVPGDYNNDGAVDASDYSVWRDKLGSTTSLPNDDTPGVGQDDYSRWKTHFGEVAAFGGGSLGQSPAAAPEPTSCLLALIGLGLMLPIRAFLAR